MSPKNIAIVVGLMGATAIGTFAAVKLTSGPASAPVAAAPTTNILGAPASSVAAVPNPAPVAAPAPTPAAPVATTPDPAATAAPAPAAAPVPDPAQAAVPPAPPPTPPKTYAPGAITTVSLQTHVHSTRTPAIAYPAEVSTWTLNDYSSLGKINLKDVGSISLMKVVQDMLPDPAVINLNGAKLSSEFDLKLDAGTYSLGVTLSPPVNLKSPAANCDVKIIENRDGHEFVLAGVSSQVVGPKVKKPDNVAITSRPTVVTAGYHHFIVETACRPDFTGIFGTEPRVTAWAAASAEPLRESIYPGISITLGTSDQDQHPITNVEHEETDATKAVSDKAINKRPNNQKPYELVKTMAPGAAVSYYLTGRDGQVSKDGRFVGAPILGPVYFAGTGGQFPLEVRIPDRNNRPTSDVASVISGSLVSDETGPHTLMFRIAGTQGIDYDLDLKDLRIVLIDGSGGEKTVTIADSDDYVGLSSNRTTSQSDSLPGRNLGRVNGLVVGTANLTAGATKFEIRNYGTDRNAGAILHGAALVDIWLKKPSENELTNVTDKAIYHEVAAK